MNQPERELRHVVGQWIEKADLDFDTVLRLAAEERFRNVVAFHAQQAAEKYIKATLTRHGIEFPKTHVITRLLILLSPVEPMLATELDEAGWLGQFGVSVRYPGDYPEMLPGDEDKAVALVRLVREAVMEVLNPWFAPDEPNDKELADKPHSLDSILARLVHGLSRLDERSLVIRSACPVMCFGDLARARIATLGLNPSNLEFEDPDGNELAGARRRFPTLGSLGIADWSQAKPEHLEEILESCLDYFLRKPYDKWFKQMESLISNTGASYYSGDRDACHLDLVPYATAPKWSALSGSSQSTLLDAAGTTLAELLRESPVQLLVLNGRRVFEQFEKMAGVPLQHRNAVRSHTGERMPERVRGVLDTLCGISLKRNLTVVGFSWNWQGPGTKAEKNIISHWIGQEAANIQTL